jgi:hypothetical protein
MIVRDDRSLSGASAFESLELSAVRGSTPIKICREIRFALRTCRTASLIWFGSAQIGRARTRGAPPVVGRRCPLWCAPYSMWRRHQGAGRRVRGDHAVEHSAAMITRKAGPHSPPAARWCSSRRPRRRSSSSMPRRGCRVGLDNRFSSTNSLPNGELS